MKKSLTGFGNYVIPNVIQNVTSEVVIDEGSDIQNAEIIYEQIDADDIIYEIDNTGVDLTDYQYMEQCGDAIILHKELPSYNDNLPLSTPQNICTEPLKAGNLVNLTDRLKVEQSGASTNVKHKDSSKLDKSCLDSAGNNVIVLQNINLSAPTTSKTFLTHLDFGKDETRKDLMRSQPPKKQLQEFNLLNKQLNDPLGAALSSKSVPSTGKTFVTHLDFGKDETRKDLMRSPPPKKQLQEFNLLNKQLNDPLRAALSSKSVPSTGKTFVTHLDFGKDETRKDLMRSPPPKKQLQEFNLLNKLLNDGKKNKTITLSKVIKNKNVSNTLTHGKSKQVAAQITVIPSVHPKLDPKLNKQSQNRPQKLLRLNLDTNADVFNFLYKSQALFRAETLNAILLVLSKDHIAEHAKLKEFCKSYVADMKFKWMTAEYNKNIFETKFAFWLRLDVKWPAFIKTVLTTRTCRAPVVHSIQDLEKSITKICCEYGKKDAVDVIHRLLSHPNDAARIRALVENSHCSCNQPANVFNKIEDVDPLLLETEICRSTESSKGLRLTENKYERVSRASANVTNKIVDRDPLLLDTEVCSTTEPSERLRLTENKYKRVYKAPSGSKLDALKEAMNKLREY